MDNISNEVLIAIVAAAFGLGGGGGFLSKAIMNARDGASIEPTLKPLEKLVEKMGEETLRLNTTVATHSAKTQEQIKTAYSRIDKIDVRLDMHADEIVKLKIGEPRP